MLTHAFGGVIGRGFFSTYRKFRRESPATGQSSTAHLIREIRFAAEHPNQVLSR